MYFHTCRLECPFLAGLSNTITTSKSLILYCNECNFVDLTDFFYMALTSKTLFLYGKKMPVN